MQTELWYTDEHTRDVRFSMKTIEQIASKKSAVQQIDILDTPAYGRVLVLDGGLMITEKDEFIYHEMLAHVPMAVHPRVRNVLVIGGGDGGTVRELTKYRSIESIDLVLNLFHQFGHLVLIGHHLPDVQQHALVFLQFLTEVH